MSDNATVGSAKLEPRAENFARRPPAPLWTRLTGAEAPILFLLLLGAWYLVTALLPLAPNSLLPSPERVLIALKESLPELLRGTWSSFLILVPGYLAAAILGVAGGLLVGTVGWLGRAFVPFARVVAPVPPTVYIPYAIAVLPTFQLSAIFVVFIGAFWPIFVSSIAGAHSLDGRHRDNARILGIEGGEFRWRIVLPASLPHIFSGMAVGLALSFVLLTVGELFGANAGLGRFVQYYADFADYPRMVAGILYTGLVTYLAMSALAARVDYVSSPGFLEGGKARWRYPFAGGGPSAIVTTLGILRPDARTREVVLYGYYPFTDIEAIRGQTGWELKAAPELAPVPEPSAEELDALRRVDVTGMLRKGSR